MADSFQFNEAALPWNSEQTLTSPMPMSLQKPHTPNADAQGDYRLEMAPLLAPLTSLKGLGARGQELLSKVLAKPLTPPRVIDLLWHLPTGYTDRRATSFIRDAQPGGLVTLEVTPIRHSLPPRASARAPVRVVCEDDSGTLDVVFFHGDRNQIKRLLPLNEPCVLSGRVEKYGSRLQMTHPDYIVTPAERNRIPPIEPIYPLTLGLTQKFLYKMMGEALNRLPQLPEWLDTSLLEGKHWPSFQEALRVLHRPTSEADLAMWSAARERLGFDEVFSSQLAIALVRRGYREIAGRSLVGDGHLSQKMRAALPYTLTRSQEQALAEIKADMASSRRMLRLLQGDVGSGKTVVAALAMAAAVEAGVQTAIMAPTDVLARQHLETLKPLCESAGITLGYLSGREQGKTRAALQAKLKWGRNPDRRWHPRAFPAGSRLP